MSSAGDLTSQVHMRISHQIMAVKSESVRCSVVSVFVTPWTVACQAPLSMEFSRQEYWSGLSLPFPGDLPDPGTEPRSPALQADSLITKLRGNPFSYNTCPLKFLSKKQANQTVGVVKERKKRGGN